MNKFGFFLLIFLGAWIGKLKAQSLYVPNSSTGGIADSDNGYIGIGTANPAFSLDVMGTGFRFKNALTGHNSYTTFRIQGPDYEHGLEIDFFGNNNITSDLNWSYGGGPGSATIMNINAKPLILGTANVPRLFIKGNGSVGIGTTQPDDIFEVSIETRKVGLNTDITGVNEGGVISFSRSDGLKTLFLGTSQDDDAVLFAAGGSNEFRLISGGGSRGFSFYTSPHNSGQSAFGSRSSLATPALRVDEHGNVGVGISNPTAKLNLHNENNYNFNDLSSNQDHILLSGTDPGVNGFFGGITWKSGGRRRASIVATREHADEDFVGIAFLTKGPDGSGPMAESMRITRNGNVAIGTTNPGSFRLAVEGKIGAREVVVTLDNPWPDYIFDSAYNLPPLSEVEAYIKTNKHLPEIPSESEVKENGVALGEMNALLLKKIEELTLYVIEQNATNEAQQRMVEEQLVKIKEQREMMELLLLRINALEQKK